MLNEAIQRIAEKLIKEALPHGNVPALVLAKVTKGGSHINVKILDEFENVDSNYAEIPNVITDGIYETGEKVVLGFLYGKLEMPIVIRKWDNE